MKIIKYKSLTEAIDGRKIIDTKHAIDRFVDRYKGTYPLHRVHKVIEDAMKTIIGKYNDEATTYGVYSKSTGICVIIDWRPDSMNRKGEVIYADSLEQYHSNGYYYRDDLYTQRFYTKHVYRGELYTLVFCDPHVDGMKWWRVFLNANEVK